LQGEEISNQVEEQNKDELWRGRCNSTECRTGAMDKYRVRTTLLTDVVGYLERGDIQDKDMLLPSAGWQGAESKFFEQSWMQ